MTVTRRRIRLVPEPRGPRAQRPLESCRRSLTGCTCSRPNRRCRRGRTTGCGRSRGRARPRVAPNDLSLGAAVERDYHPVPVSSSRRAATRSLDRATSPWLDLKPSGERLGQAVHGAARRDRRVACSTSSAYYKARPRTSCPTLFFTRQSSSSFPEAVLRRSPRRRVAAGVARGRRGG